MQGSILILAVTPFLPSLAALKEAHHWRRKFGVVKDGVLLRSRLPTVQNLEQLKCRYGIRTIISLLDWRESQRHPEHFAEQVFAARSDIRLIHIPISIPTPEEVARFLSILDDEANWPILVHCEQGTVRTGLLVAVFRIENEGWSNEDALREMVSYGFDSRLSRYQNIVDFVLGHRATKPCRDAESEPRRTAS